MAFDLDDLNPDDLTAILSGVSLKIKGAIVREITENPEQYVDLMPPKEEPQGGELEVVSPGRRRNSAYKDLGPYEPDPSLEALDGIVEAVESGKDIKPHAPKIQRLIHNQDARAEIVDSLLTTHEYRRLAQFLKARGKIESVLLAVAARGELSASEALAFLQFIQGEIKGMSARVRSSSASHKDMAQMIEKLDFALQQDEAAVAAAIEGTSPQNREVVRRLGHRMIKLAKMKSAEGGQS